MQLKLTLISALALISTPLIGFASVRPVASLSAGVDVVNIHMTQNITILAPFQNSYVANTRIEDFVGGLFVGFETPLFSQVLGQLGVSYYENSGYLAQGIVYQFTDPAMGNLFYQYSIQSQRLLLEGKLLTTCHQKYHPFINVGLGRTKNTASDYIETPVVSTSVPMTPGFGNNTSYSFTYLIGAGIEMDIDPHTRLGLMYRYVNLGKANLGTTPLQESTTTLSNNPLYTNEVMLQLTYLG